MPSFQERTAGDVKAYVCRPLEEAGFLNAFSTRPGGVSPLPSNALNLAHMGDDPANVEENRRRFLKAAGLPSLPIVTIRQTHSTTVVDAAADLIATTEGDALLARNPNFLIGVKTADCVPILLADPASGLCAAVHAGWRGAVAGIVKTAVAAMKNAGAKLDSMIAAFGPAACGRCYQVGDDVAEKFRAIGAGGCLTRDGDKWLLDVPRACARHLEESQVPAHEIYYSNLCTIHGGEALFFSHRREAKDGQSYGRQLSVIGRKA